MQRRNIAAQYIEMPVEFRIGDEVHAGLDHGLAAPLRQEPALDRIEDLLVRHRQPLDVRPV
jgi:hypothetical protein